MALEHLRELQQGDDTRGALRPGGESGNHGDGVVICLYNDDLVFPVLRSLATLFRQRGSLSRQPPVDIAGFHRLPVHPGLQVHLDRPPAGTGQQIPCILPLDPETGNIDGYLQEFVCGLLPADEPIIEKDDGPGAQGNRIQVILAAVEVEQDNAPFHRFSIQFLQISPSSVDQGAAHPALRQRRSAHAVGPQAVEFYGLTSFHHQFGPPVQRYGHLEGIGANTLQAQFLEAPPDVVVSPLSPWITRHPGVPGRKKLDLSFDLVPGNSSGCHGADLPRAVRGHKTGFSGFGRGPSEEGYYRLVDPNRVEHPYRGDHPQSQAQK